MEAKGEDKGVAEGLLSATDFNSHRSALFAFGPARQARDLAFAIGALLTKVYSAGLHGGNAMTVRIAAFPGWRTFQRATQTPHVYPRIAALALSAAAVITTFAGFAPEIASLTPIMKASRMIRDLGWKRIALARSTSAFCRLVSAASAACAPNAFLKPSLDQADTRVVASPAAAVLSEVGLLVAHSRNRKAARLCCDLEFTHACQCDMNGTGERPGRCGKAANPACFATGPFAGLEISVAKLLLSIAIAVLSCRKSSNTWYHS